MTDKKLVLLLALAAALAVFASPAEAADAAKGQAIYMRWCSDCHAAAGGRYGIPPPGWNILQQRYKGTTIPGELDKRTDLAPDYIRTIVRTGINLMPRTRKTEITDAELDDLIAYINRPK